MRFLLLAVVALLVMTPQVSSSQAKPAAAATPMSAELQATKAALAKYADPIVAIRDGYFSTVACIDFPKGADEGSIKYPAGAMSHCIAQHPDAFAVLCAEKQKYFLRPAVKLYERKEMRLIENPAADRKDCLEVPATKLTRFVSEARRERSVHIADLPIVTERDKSAWGMFEQIGVHVIRDNP